jgi:polar amino acid transport system permease protein
MLEYMPLITSGALLTVQIAVAAAAAGMVLAVIAGLAKISRYRSLRWVANVYIETFRGTSLLVQLFWFFFVLPHFGITLPPFITGVVAIGLNVGAYGAEVVRGAIQSVDRGQYDAAVALNMSRGTMMRYVIAPQAVRAMLPPCGNLMIQLVKDTSLASLITLPELTFQAQLVNSVTLRTEEIYLVVLIIYFVIAQFFSVLVRALEWRVGRGIARGSLS